MQIKEIYVVLLNGYVGAYIDGKCPTKAYAPRNKFVDFVSGLIEDYPNFKIRCVRSKKIEKKIEQQIFLDTKLKEKTRGI